MNLNVNERPEHPQAEQEQPPPFMRSWNRIYVAIALYTCALIAALYIITVSLNR